MNNYEKLLYKSKRQKRQLSILGHKINLYKKQLEAYENMRKELKEYEKENQRLNDDIKILLKENEAKEKVIIKQDNVLNELEKMFDSDEHFEDGCYCSEIERYLYELKESDK